MKKTFCIYVVLFSAVVTIQFYNLKFILSVKYSLTIVTGWQMLKLIFSRWFRFILKLSKLFYIQMSSQYTGIISTLYIQQGFTFCFSWA